MPIGRPQSGPILQPASGVFRAPLSERCELTTDRDRSEGITWNVSTLGAYVALEKNTPELGRKLRLSFRLEGDRLPIICEAEVRWENPPSALDGYGSLAGGLPPGCGLKFLWMAEPDRRRIEAYVNAVRQRRLT